MRINAGRLDLRTLRPGVMCVVITTDTSVWLSQQGLQEVPVEIAVEDVGDFHLVTKENGARVDWLNLRALRPGRMYQVAVSRIDENSIDWHLSDVTPGWFDGEPKSGGPGWGILGQLLGRKR